jgi:inositol polyphosphate-4-phosphatase
MGELHEPWHSRQVELLDRHLHLLRLYSQAKENLEAQKGMSSHCTVSSQSTGNSKTFKV